MSNELGTSEVTPLRRAVDRASANFAINNNNYRRAIPSPTNNQQLPITLGSSSQIERKMESQSRTITKIILDVLILLCVGLPILFFWLWGTPYTRGFFCDDLSLKHPFHESTVKNYVLYVVGIGLPVFVIIVTEMIQANASNNTIPKYSLFDWDIPPWIVESYKQIGVFGFGACCSQLITDIGKYSIGRLRPHFISVCQPQMLDGTTCSDPQNIGRYITDFQCIGAKNSTRLIKEMRLSFPSGHSSFSAYTMLYCALYLQSRLTWSRGKLLKHGIQFFLIMLAWFTALSRVSDYKHHWSDALAGSLLGSLTALTVANCVSDLFDRRASKQILPSTRHELTNSPGTNGHV